MFRIHALPAEAFAPLFALDDQAQRTRGARRIVTDPHTGFPCRVSLRDATPGETLLLVHHQHHPVDSPYRAGGPIFVRERDTAATPAIDEIPTMLRHRLLSLRGYGADGHDLRQADVVEGEALADAITAMLADPGIAYLHLHFARPGCYAARVSRG